MHTISSRDRNRAAGISCASPFGIAAFLQESLALWGVAGEATSEQPEAVRVHGPGGLVVAVERAPADSPFRWFVRWQESAAGTEPRTRPCGSLVGVLAALRRALGVERGSAIRIAPAPDEDDGPGPAIPPAPPANDHDGAASAQSDGSEHGGAAAPFAARVPITVLTGFLGSGKTTLLARLLRHPAMGRTAVIVNEFGEIGLDHDLIETSDEQFVQLSTGCLCCNVRSDLVLTLADLAARRARGAVAPFERVVIETSGLADPAPILHALMTDRGLSAAYVLEAVVTTVDAITGARTLERHPESVRQVAVADTILLTKTDLPQSEADAVEALLRRHNSDARVLRAVRGDIAPAVLFQRASEIFAPLGSTGAAEGLLASPSGSEAGHEEAASEHGEHGSETPAHEHTEHIGTFSLVRTEPIHAATLALFVSALADNCGADLLRVKGIAQIAEHPQRPAVVQGVQHCYFPPRWLARWPSPDRRTRMVFIGTGIRRSWVEALLALLEMEVADETAARTASG